MPSATQSMSMELKPLTTAPLPEFEVVLRNTGSELVQFLAYMLDYRLKAAMVANRQGKGASYEAQPFRKVAWATPQASDLISLAPGQEHRHVLRWDDPWDFGFVQRHSQPSTMTPRFKLHQFPAGTFDFKTVVFNEMAIYVGQDGVFDHTLESRRLPQDLPNAALLGHAFIGDLEAFAQISF